MHINEINVLKIFFEDELILKVSGTLLEILSALCDTASVLYLAVSGFLVDFEIHVALRKF